MNNIIRHQFFYQHSVETIWAYLTEQELLSQWLMDNDFELSDGHEFQFRTKPHPDVNFDGIFYCKVLEIVTLKKLSYSWNANASNGGAPLNSIVTWTLEEKNNGTEVSLEHSGFNDENFGIYTGMKAGWLEKIQKIANCLKTSKNVSAHT